MKLQNSTNHFKILNKHNGSIGITLFGSIFLLIGLGFLFLAIIPNLYDWISMMSWTETDAVVLNVKLDTNSGDDGETYKVIAAYRYWIKNKAFEGDRVSISSSADNIGDYQRDLYYELKKAKKNKQGIKIWVNPSDNYDSIIDREIRWGLFALKLVFLIVFATFGLFIIFAGMKSGSKKSQLPDNEPWVEYSKYGDNRINSEGKSLLLFLYFFTIIWNAISIPISIIILNEELQNENTWILLILLFPLIGAGLFISTIIKTIEYRKFGVIDLAMDPFPGSIGGDVAGVIEIKRRYEHNTLYKIAISCSHVKISSSGSGSNRSSSRHEKLIWESETIAESEPGRNQTLLSFKFEVPDGLPESTPSSSDFYEWKIYLNAEVAGVDLNRTFIIPVYATAEKSKEIKSLSPRVDMGNNDDKIDKIVTISETMTGTNYYYSPGRGIKPSIVLVLVGTAFAAAVFFMLQQGFSRDGFGFESIVLIPMSLIFGLSSLAMIAFAFYLTFNSLSIDIDSDKIISRRKILGMTVSHKEILSSEIIRIEKKNTMQSTNANSAPTVWYGIYAHGRLGKKVKIAESLIGAKMADYFVEELKKKVKN
jgi:hypothetical protein